MIINFFLFESFKIYITRLSFFHILISSCFLPGFRPCFNSNSVTSFWRLAISSSRALRVDSSILMVSFKDCLVSATLCSTSTPPTTFQHLRYPFKGYKLASTRLFSLRYSSSSMYRLKISAYSFFSLL